MRLDLLKRLGARGVSGMMMGLFVAITWFGASTAIAAAGAAPAKAEDRDAKCIACHDESWRTPVLSIYQTRHGVKTDSRTPGCQGCHGESQGHLSQGPGTKPDVVFGLKSKNLSTAEERNGSCLSCHEKKVLARTNWTGSQHESQGLACNSCHEVHTPNQKVMAKATQAEVCFTCHKTERAQSHRLSVHPITTSASGAAPKMSCSDCHNPHGTTGPKLLIKNTVNETCFTCHAEKRGPFLWEHMPASDDCSNCHQPHGSSNVGMLKTRPPFLCQQCHQDHGATLRGSAAIPNSASSPAPNVATPLANFGKALAVQGNGRMCLNCHVMVHGSNHPAGAALAR